MSKVKEGIKSKSIDSVTMPDNKSRPTADLIYDLEAVLNTRVSKGLISPAEKQQIIREALDQQRQLANEVIEKYKKNQIGDRAEAEKYAEMYNLEMRDMIKKGFQAEDDRKTDEKTKETDREKQSKIDTAKGSEKITKLTSELSDKISATRIGTAGFNPTPAEFDQAIQDQIDAAKVLDPTLTTEELDVLKNNLQEKLKPLFAVTQSKTYEKGTGDLLQSLKDEAAGLTGFEQNAVDGAIKAIEAMRTNQKTIETGKKDIERQKIEISKREGLEATDEKERAKRLRTMNQVKLIAKYAVPAAILAGGGVGIGLGLLEAKGGVIALSALLAGTTAGTVAGYGRHQYASHFWDTESLNKAGINKKKFDKEQEEFVLQEKLAAQKQLELTQNINSIDLAAVRRDVQTSTATVDVISTIIAKKTGSDVGEIKGAAEIAFGTRNSRELERGLTSLGNIAMAA